MFDDALGFLKQKVSQGLSDVENWGSDVGNDVTHALGTVFGTNSTPTNQAPALSTQAPKTPQTPASLGSLPINNPLAPQQQNTQQNPMLKLNFGNTQNQQQQVPQNTPQTLNTNLVNFKQPTTPAVNLKTPAMTPAISNLVSPQTPPLQQQLTRIAQEGPGGDPIGHFINQALIKPVTNTVAGDVVEPVRSLTAQLTHNPAAEQAANQRGAQDVQNSLPVAIGKGVGRAAQAAYNLEGKSPIEQLLGNQQASNQARTTGLKEINQSFVGPAITGPEDIIAHAAGGKNMTQTANQIGFNPNASIASNIAKTAAGIPSAAYPLYGVTKLLGAASAPSDAMTIAGFGNAANTLKADPDIANAVKEIQGKTVLPQSEEESLNATEGRATAQKEVDTQPSSYQLRKGQGVTPDMITDADRRQASYSSTTPEKIAGQRIVNARKLDAEQAAQEVLEKDGTRDEAITAYQDHNPGITRKDATYQVSRMARESKLALRPNERIENPEEG